MGEMIIESCIACRVSGFECRVGFRGSSGLGRMSRGLGFRACGLELSVWGLEVGDKFFLD